MTDASTRTCAACGAAVAGNYCNACGAPTGPRTCRACQAALSPQARFCHRCGEPAATPRTRAAGSDRAAWLFAGSAVLLLVVVILLVLDRNHPSVKVPDMANAGNAAPANAPFAGDPGGGLPNGRAPDISKMSPADRFLRLNNRVMEAAARADSATVVNFTPMALAAYTQLDTITNDDRYHAAVLHAQIGQIDAAQALTDTMLLTTPGYLLAYVIRGDIAGFREDSAALRSAYAGFRDHYPAESQARRTEYADHANVIDDFKRKAGMQDGPGNSRRP